MSRSTYSATEVCCVTSKVLPANTGISRRPRIMAASASAAGNWAMSGAFWPAVRAPPRPVALWQPAQYRRYRSPPRPSSASCDAGSAREVATYSATASICVLRERVAERRHLDAALQDHGADQLGEAGRGQRRPEGALALRRRDSPEQFWT